MFLIHNLKISKKKSPGLEVFTGKCSKCSKRINKIKLNLFQKLEEKETLPNLFYKAITVLP